MIGGVETVSALSFTRGLDGAQESGGSSSIVQNPLGAAGGTSATGDDFGTTLAGITGDMVTTLREAEQASFDGINGKADTREVVDAVMAAEQTLQTAIAIRDKIVTAYLEISRMQI